MEDEIISQSVCLECFQKFEEYDEAVVKAAVVAEKLIDLYRNSQKSKKKVESKTKINRTIQLRSSKKLKSEAKNDNKTIDLPIVVEVKQEQDSDCEMSAGNVSSDEDFVPEEEEAKSAKVPSGYKSIKLQENFDCFICGEKNLMSKSNFDRHMESHDLSRKRCDLCNQTFKTKSNLEIHISTFHKGMNPNECPICHKVFNQKASLSRHVAIHTGKKITDYLFSFGNHVNCFIAYFQLR